MSRLRSAPAGDDGFSLTEVVVALGLLAVVATAAGAFFIKGMGATSALQQRQVAVAVANGAMEQVHSFNPAPLSYSVGSSPLGIAQVGGLPVGRSKNAVNGSWDTAQVPELAATLPTWDAAAGQGAEPAVPLSTVATIAGRDYTVRTWIGVCARPASGGTCGTSDLTAPGAVSLERVVVQVSWSGGLGGCPASGCTYRVSALVDPGSDATWRLS